MVDLYGIDYSPWTAKARWVLDYHQIPYRYHEHILLLGIPELRWRLRRFRGDVTLPALVAGNDRILDSFAIARYADARGGGASLFPKERLEEIKKVNSLSEKALSAARALFVFRLFKDPEARVEALPPFVPEPFRKSLQWVASVGASYVAREFDIFKKTAAGYEEDYRSVLEQFRSRLRGTQSCLLGHFSFADIAAALALQGVEPIVHPTFSIGPSLRRTWRNPQLAEDYQDLLEWRDEIFRKHR